MHRFMQPQVVENMSQERRETTAFIEQHALVDRYTLNPVITPDLHFTREQAHRAPTIDEQLEDFYHPRH